MSNKRSLLKPVGVLAFAIAIATSSALAQQTTDGFSRPYTLEFKLNSAAHMQGNEVLRKNWDQKDNNDSSGSGGKSGMGNENSNNMVQLNTTIILNGDNNTVTQTGGEVNATQTSEGTNQSGTNAVGCKVVLNAPGC